jgi:hypothetical protein
VNQERIDYRTAERERKQQEQQDRQRLIDEERAKIDAVLEQLRLSVAITASM